MTEPRPAIRKAALLVIDETRHRILLCRKRSGTSLLILPGGRIEEGETAGQCVIREVHEELGVGVLGLQPVGRYVDIAAGETSRLIEVELFTGILDHPPAAQSEIAELVWFDIDDDRSTLAPSIANKILPDLIRRGIVS